MYMYMDIINTIDKAVVTINVGGGGGLPQWHSISVGADIHYTSS